MVISQSKKRLLVSVGLVAAGLVAGGGLYLSVMFAMAAAGFYTLSFGTGSFVALAVSLLVASVAEIVARRGAAEDAPDFVRQLRTFLWAAIALHALLCVFAVIFMPETVLFWPHS